MDIKPANQKKLVYPLATAVVVGSAMLSGCGQQQQQQRLGGEPPQALGGVIMVEPAKGDIPVKADK
jgi:hypothetical protein